MGQEIEKRLYEGFANSIIKKLEQYAVYIIRIVSTWHEQLSLWLLTCRVDVQLFDTDPTFCDLSSCHCLIRLHFDQTVLHCIWTVDRWRAPLVHVPSLCQVPSSTTLPHVASIAHDLPVSASPFCPILISHTCILPLTNYFLRSIPMCYPKHLLQHRFILNINTSRAPVITSTYFTPIYIYMHKILFRRERQKKAS